MYHHYFYVKSQNLIISASSLLIEKHIQVLGLEVRRHSSLFRLIFLIMSSDDGKVVRNHEYRRNVERIMPIFVASTAFSDDKTLTSSESIYKHGVIWYFDYVIYDGITMQYFYTI